MDIWNSIAAAALAMSRLEFVAVFFGIASVIYSRQENILVYPTGIVSVLIYIYLCFGVKLYADMGINVFYFVMSVYGWYNWGKQKKGETLHIQSNSTKENVLSAIAVVVLWGGLYLFLSEFTDSDVPFIDSFTTAVCFVGMWLMAWKRLENWTLWIIADLVSVPLYWYKGLHLTSVQFMFFTVLAIMGYREWNRRLVQ